MYGRFGNATHLSSRSWSQRPYQTRLARLCASTIRFSSRRRRSQLRRRACCLLSHSLLFCTRRSTGKMQHETTTTRLIAQGIYLGGSSSRHGWSHWPDHRIARSNEHVSIVETLISLLIKLLTYNLWLNNHIRAYQSYICSFNSLSVLFTILLVEAWLYPAVESERWGYQQ